VADLTPPAAFRWAIVIVDFDPTVGHEQAGSRRALVVSNEAFHRSGLATVCPISARDPKYPGEVHLPVGTSGQTKDASILVHQIRTIDLRRVAAWLVSGRTRYVIDPVIRAEVRSALAHHLGLDAAERG
jgi:mRNA-degrading endonuclease toxin of MazEF toxin-antitoxin module